MLPTASLCPKPRLSPVVISSINSCRNHSRPSTPLSFDMCTRLTLSHRRLWFTDVHVNLALRNRFESGEPRAPVVILGFSPDDGHSIKFRHDAWVHNMWETLAVQDDFLEPGHSSPPHIKELKHGRGFEVSRRSKIAIWHGGFIEAEWRIKTICGWLTGVVDDLNLAAIN